MSSWVKNPNAAVRYDYSSYYLALLLTSMSVTMPTAVADSEDGGSGGGHKSLLLAHGWLFWLAFGLLFPIGILLARYGQQYRLLQNWFKLHWIVQVVATAVAVAGLVAVLTSGEDVDAGVHGTLGYAVGAIVLAHLSIAFFARPNKGGRFRREWFFTHWLVGMGVIVVAWLTIFLGMEVYDENFEQIKAFKVAFIAQISILVFIYLLLERWPYIMSQKKASEIEHDKQSQVQSNGEMHAIL